MNKKQKIILWIGIGVLLLMGLFPPWIQSWNVDNYRGKSHLGFHFVLDPPKTDGYFASYSGVQVATTQLLTQAAFVVLITGGLVLALKDKD